MHPERQTGTYLKVHGDGRPSPLLLVISGQQFNLCTYLGFLHSSHTFYSIGESPEVRRCQSLWSLSLHYLRAERSTKQTLPPQGLPLQASPNMLTYFQTMAFSLALYFAFPFMQMTCTPLVLRGVGIRTWKAQSGKQEQGDYSLGTLGSLRHSVLNPSGLISPSSVPREHKLSQGILG